ncbi:hypothetical protein CPB85DRAFT_1443363 [Mucidula mucida]|nr:hypothetical protein CPB85DRAFT_1443363 [Mucidula mucida]
MAASTIRALGFDLKKAEVLKRQDGSWLDGVRGFRENHEKLLERDPLEDLQHAFRHHTGKISLRNLRRVAKEIGDRLEDDELQAMIDEFDLDQDGEISEQEFYAIMRDDV